MKHKILQVGILLLPICGISQQGATGSPIANVNYNDWYRGGNSGNALSPNIFGTIWNSPIYTQTNAVSRMKLNGNIAYPVNGVNDNRNGYLLLGINNPLLGGGGSSIYDANRGAFSLLHLNGEGGTSQQLGHRVWMKTGITFTGNHDLSYFGLRQIGSGVDRTETVIAWSDNQSGIADEMTFRFMGQNGSSAGATESLDFINRDDLDGLHVARFSPQGRFGLGNTFGHIDLATGMANATTHSTPQSLMHLSYQYRAGSATEAYGFMQVTYRREYNTPSDIIGEGELFTDGLRFGIDNDIFGTGPRRHLNGYLRWQEASSFIIQTEDDDANPNIQQNERMRITSIGALTSNYLPSHIMVVLIQVLLLELV